MPWASLCKDLSEGRIGSQDFRRYNGTRNVVETVGPVDGRFYAKRIREWGEELLDHPAVKTVDNWGDPIRWPSFLLGTPRAFSPTTLRYLATALWLKRCGFTKPGDRIVEIGVGFGGLAAMNGIASNCITILVDLPQVRNTAMHMLSETGLARFAESTSDIVDEPISCVISNYAFSELNTATQDLYFDKYLRRAEHGIIVSNASVFASTALGRTDDELVNCFRAGGIDARLHCNTELLCPSDHICRVNIISW